MEMINLLHFIQPSLFSKHIDKLEDLFKQNVTLQDVSDGALLYGDRIQRGRRILLPFILQRRKEQVLLDLPKKTCRIVKCAMDPGQKPIYDSYERRFRRGNAGEPPRSSQTAVTGLASDQNNVWIQLRKAAIHAQLFRRYFDDRTVEEMAKTLMDVVGAAELRQPELKHLINELKDLNDLELHVWCQDYPCLARYDIPERSTFNSGKVAELLKLVEQFQANGDRVLVFSKFAKVINILREVLALSGIPYLSIDGDTKVTDRTELIDEWNENKDIPVFLLTTGTGGTGLNLTAANKVVIFDMSDNPQDDVQAENRAHRLGQTRDVEVIRLITKGTIEELLYSACRNKLRLAEQVTGYMMQPDVESENLEAVRKEESSRIEEEVRKMLLAGGGMTPPESEGGKSGGEEEAG
jgi:SWI/SNF-related matrix-associated actin-dependent regulator of chromatin subfamily A containing DEAD/H box 1